MPVLQLVGGSEVHTEFCVAGVYVCRGVHGAWHVLESLQGLKQRLGGVIMVGSQPDVSHWNVARASW